MGHLQAKMYWMKKGELGHQGRGNSRNSEGFPAEKSHSNGGKKNQRKEGDGPRGRKV